VVHEGLELSIRALGDEKDQLRLDLNGKTYEGTGPRGKTAWLDEHSFVRIGEFNIPIETEDEHCICVITKKPNETHLHIVSSSESFDAWSVWEHENV
jgi:hypothetical protein